MIAHEHPGMHAPAGHLAGLRQRVQKKAAVIIVMENGLPAVTPGHDVVVLSGGLDAIAECHARQLALCNWFFTV